MAVIEQSTPVNTVLFDVNATDADDPALPNSDFSFALANGAQPFSINSATGVLRVSGSLTVQKYSVGVTVTDEGSPMLQSTTNFTVEVVRDNNHTPVFLPPLVGSINENTPMASASFLVDDADDGEVGTVEVMLVPSNFTEDATISSSINSNGTTTFTIVFNREFDRETLQEFLFNVTATDSGEDLFRRTSEAEITIMIDDLNDNTPYFIGEPYITNVAENASVGYPFFQVNASDEDIGKNSELTFSLTNHNDVFSINSSGWLAVNGKLLKARVPQYMVTVRACDQGSPTMCNSTSVEVEVTEVNDNHPQFVTPLNGAEFTVFENITTGHVFVNISVTDIDIGPPGEVSLSLAQSDLPFAINGTLLVLSSELDYEVNEYDS